MDQQEKSDLPALKVCGLTTAVDVAYCQMRGVDYVGFNFYTGSKRYVAPTEAAQAWAAAQNLAPQRDALQTRPVAVVVDMPLADLAAALAVFPGLVAVQFHGRETLAELRAFRAALGGRPLAIWQALPVRSVTDVAASGVYQRGAASTEPAAADLLLFDAAVIPPGASVAGGSGHSFDWSWLAAYSQRVGAHSINGLDGINGVNGPADLLPYGVAGGLKAGNLASLAVATKAAAKPVALIDVCSGVETAPGRKDHTLIDAVLAARAAAW